MWLELQIISDLWDKNILFFYFLKDCMDFNGLLLSFGDIYNFAE